MSSRVYFEPGGGSFWIPGVNPTLTYQNLQKSRVPINSILGFIIRTYKTSRVWKVKVNPKPGSRVPEALISGHEIALRFQWLQTMK